MSVKDVIKKSVLELETFKNSFTVETIISILIALLVAVAFGVFIHFVYTKFFRGVVYSRNFSITLVGITIMTTMVTLAISTNIVISLGMVGALSIVRFRTAVKDPLDLLYLFWAITTGITIGAYMYPLVLASSIIMLVLIMVMTRKSRRNDIYIAIIHYKGEDVSDSIRVVMARADYKIKSKTSRGELNELAMEVNVKNDNFSFSDKLKAIDGVQEVTLIQYDGEYHG
ncbi:MAG: DUF4956 domain-containing protein [Oscillospiraceae bacterium]|nr:DUF4956 domain-containing protein [Oscillospiraceae bacterium]MDD4414198.1 DUF4956 domain-containing protein [Oscillospiraceae bacterium]